MLKKILSKLRPLTKSLLIFALILTLVLGDAGNALAARSGGRMGGGSFRAPSRTYTAPRGGYSSPGYGYGGGIGFPFILPFFGFGGGFGGLFTILIFIAIANFLVKAVRNFGSEGDEGMISSNPKVSVAKVQVGLLASGRYLQTELNELAFKVDTSTAQGRAELLQESTLALLRHPEYWVYGNAEAQPGNLSAAESQFNQWTLAERSKFNAETLSNVNNQLQQFSPTSLPASGGELTPNLDTETGYIITTLIVGTEGKLNLPQINDSQDLRQALQQLGGIGSDRLLAIEVLWTPQAEGDVLTTDDILAAYPNLKLV
jgi:uncharacterized membrane protein